MPLEPFSPFHSTWFQLWARALSRLSSVERHSAPGYQQLNLIINWNLSILCEENWIWLAICHAACGGLMEGAPPLRPLKWAWCGSISSCPPNKHIALIWTNDFLESQLWLGRNNVCHKSKLSRGPAGHRTRVSVYYQFVYPDCFYIRGLHCICGDFSDLLSWKNPCYIFFNLDVVLGICQNIWKQLDGLLHWNIIKYILYFLYEYYFGLVIYWGLSVWNQIINIKKLILCKTILQ